MSQANGRRVVGLEPWLPWPLRAWSWWAQPVRAERLAVLRIAMAGCLLVDVLTSYRFGLDFFAPDGLGGSKTFAYYADAPKLNWSLLRGFNDPILGALALVTWFVLTAWFALDFWGKRATRDGSGTQRDGGLGVLLWLACGVYVTLGVWSRSIKDAGDSPFPWTVPLGMSSCAVMFLFLELWKRTWSRRRDGRLAFFLLNALVLISLAVISLFLTFKDWSEERTFSLGHRLLLPWQDDPTFLSVALWLWVAATALLVVGCWTRWAAIGAWALSMSFASANPNIDNAGDTIRVITLFYLMLCPCGAAWSVDRFFQRRREGDGGPVYVWPWALRLLFMQMVFMYFMNGAYKVTGANWVEGDSLYYVLCDITLTRVSIAQLPVPFWLAQISTWLVLAWELTFPVMVIFRRTYGVALFFGVLFHLGIFATMELGGFVPYVLCLYLPLLPWDRWLKV
jgi:hypothetical protein